MKRWGLLIVLGVLLLNQPFEASDVARLKPVEVVRVSANAHGICVETDTGDSGMGDSLSEAFLDLKATANGDVFWETADRVLVSPLMVELVPELTDYLRPGCNVCVEMGKVELDAVGAFLDIHEPKVTLQEHRAEQLPLPVLYVIDGRMYLVE